jgi:hypothetical protein
MRGSSADPSADRGSSGVHIAQQVSSALIYRVIVAKAREHQLGEVASKFDDLVQGDGNRRRVGRLDGNCRCRRLHCGSLLSNRWLDGAAGAVITDHHGSIRAVGAETPIAADGLLGHGGAQRQSSK